MTNWMIPRHFSKKGGPGLDGTIMRNAYRHIDLVESDLGNVCISYNIVSLYNELENERTLSETTTLRILAEKDVRRVYKYGGRILRSAARIITRFLRRAAINCNAKKYWKMEN